MHIALAAQACDSVVTAQDVYIQTGLKYEAAQDSVMRLRSIMIVNLESDNRDCEAKYDNQIAITKNEKRKKRKWMGATVLIVAAEITVRFFLK